MHAGHEVLMEVDDFGVLIVGDPRGVGLVTETSRNLLLKQHNYYIRLLFNYINYKTTPQGGNLSLLRTTSAIKLVSITNLFRFKAKVPLNLGMAFLSSINLAIFTYLGQPG